MGDNYASLVERQFTNLSGKYNHVNVINTYGSEQNRRYFADDIFKSIIVSVNVCIFNEHICILIQIQMKCVPRAPSDH